jgi:hypothetical protein
MKHANSTLKGDKMLGPTIKRNEGLQEMWQAIYMVFIYN